MNARTLLSIQRPITGTWLSYSFVLSGFFMLGMSMWDLYNMKWVAFGSGAILSFISIYIGARKIKRC